MHRSLARCALATARAVTLAAAVAAPGASAFTGGGVQPSLRSLGSASGMVTAINGSVVTIQTAGRLTGTINALIQSADAVTQAAYPYVWGGGHSQAGVASAGIKGGPGANGRRVGYDCSGSVAAVLAGAGLWPAGAGVPSDAGVIAELRRQGLIATGPGRAPNNVTLYDEPGVHIFMNIAGRFFGTSDGSGGGNARGGAGWLYDSASDATSPSFRQYHFVASVLHDRKSFGHIFTFSAGDGSALPPGLLAGDRVKISYGQSSAGAMVATALTYLGAVTTTETISSLTPDGSAFTAEGADGKPVTYVTAGPSSLLSALQLGDRTQITYTKRAGAAGRTARVVTVLANPTVTQALGAVTAIGAAGASMTVQTATGQTLTVTAGVLQSVIARLAAGVPVEVSYLTLPDGTLIAKSITGASGTTSG